MENSEITTFPGFLNPYSPDHFEYRRALSRLQNKAPAPIQVKTRPPLVIFEDAAKWSSKQTDAANACSSEKLPIPLLSPLVLPPA
ncbi:unnamed protein product [Victoria cruziana]